MAVKNKKKKQMNNNKMDKKQTHKEQTNGYQLGDGRNG